MSTNAHDIELSELKGFAHVADIIARRPLFHFSVVHSFSYYCRREEEIGDALSEIELVMEELEPPRARVGFRFHRVADVEFSGFGQIIGLIFQSIQDRGWEQLRFEVGDYENSRIHLFCHEISVFDPRNAA